MNKKTEKKINEFLTIPNNDNDNDNDNDINVAKIDDETIENFHVIMNNKVNNYLNKKLKKIFQKENVKTDENSNKINRTYQFTEINYNPKAINKINNSNNKSNDNERCLTTNNSKKYGIYSDKMKFIKKNRVINYNQENRSNSKRNIINQYPLIIYKNRKFKRNNDKLHNKTYINNNL